MAKDPAVLLYTSDFLTGTAMFTDIQVGKYIRLLCLQHQSGGIPVDYFNAIVGDQNCPVRSKFILFEDGFYRNCRMIEEAEKRKNFVASRRNNLKKTKESPHMKPHMSTHTADRMENENENENIVELDEWGELMKEWIAYRKKISKPLKKVSLPKALQNLKKISGEKIELAKEIVDNSIANGYQGLFAIKTNQQNGQSKSKQSATIDVYKDKYGELFKGQPDN